MIYRFYIHLTVTALLALCIAEAPAQETAPDPKADSRACVISGNARFTVLTPALIRMEYEPGAKFEDRATYAFINRRLPVPQYTILRNSGWLDIRTSEVQVRYLENSGAFTSDTLSVTVKRVGGPNGKTVTWRPGMADIGNLLGTVRTLDSINGATPLEPGILSREGWAVVDDTTRTLLTKDAHKPGDPLSDWPWIAERPGDPNRRDLYFFGYGHDYQRALYDFTRVAGKVPMPPGWAFGAWWSRYWAYSDKDLKELVREFREHGVPLDVLVIDMDWHLAGWTGYTWNPEYFPDPVGFMKWAHDEGLHVTLNLHPADGVAPHEAAYPEFAKLMGQDPQSSQTIPFDITNPKFVDGYFRLLHHPLQRQGVDFWWIDWQQGTQTKLTSIDPLHWLNYLHWTDMERDPARQGERPLLFSRWGGLGNHRYQTGFSGDTYNDWPSLAFQPYFTATAGNVGYGYWSHDIGGHMPGPVAPDLFDRWLQWAAFNPILRTHGGKNPATERRIWAFPNKAYLIAKQAWYLRYSLIPYIYTAARKCYDAALPLCRPLYYEWPEMEEAYAHGGEYLYGDDLLVNPVVSAEDPLSSCALQKTWLPPGVWVDWFTDKVTTGPAEIEELVSMERIPVWARAGSIIPTASVRRGDSSQWGLNEREYVKPNTLTYRTMDLKSSDTIHSSADQEDGRILLDVFPGGNGRCVLYQDDRHTTGYQVGAAAYTTITQETSADASMTTLTVEPGQGSYAGMPQKRRFEVRMRSMGHVDNVRLLVNGKEAATSIPAGSILKASNPRCIGDYILERAPAFSVGDRVQFVFERKACTGNVLAASGIRRLMQMEQEVADLASSGTFTTSSAPSLLDELCQKGGETSLTCGTFENQIIDKLKHLDPSKAAEQLKYLLQVLGITAQIHIGADTNGEFEVVIKIHRTSGDTALPIDARIVIEGADPTRTPTPQDQHFMMTPGQSEMEARWPLLVSPSGGTFRVYAHVTIKVGTTVLDLPLDAEVVPSIGDWYVVGPFDNPGGVTLDKIFPPEEMPFDPRARFMGKRGPVGWKHIERKGKPGEDAVREFVVDLREICGRRTNHAIAYAYTVIHSDRDTKATLYLGADDGVAAWLNGKEVWRNPKGRPYRAGEDRVEVQLKKGDNPLLLKISQGSNDWKFSAQLDTPPPDEWMTKWLEREGQRMQQRGVTPGPPATGAPGAMIAVPG